MISAAASVLRTAPARAPIHPVRPRVGVLTLGGLGGSSRVAWELARGLSSLGFPVRVLSSPDPWIRFDQTVSVGSVPVPRVPTPTHSEWIEPLAGALAHEVRARDLEVLSVHYGAGLAAAAVEARRRLRARGHDVRLCVTLHGTDVTHFALDPVEGPRLAQTLRACDAVTAVSGWLADRAVDALDLPRRPDVIANGVDTELFRPAAIRVHRARPVLCHASNFRAVKRPLDALEVLARLHRHGTDAELWMIGDGPLRPCARDHARALGLGHRLRWIDPVSPDRLATLLPRVDLSVVTSASESFGLFALESMASGTPVLATRCGGLEEVFGADPTRELAAELLADVGDVDDLARRAWLALSTPSRLARLRARSLEVGRRAFPLDRQRHAFAQVLDRVCTAEPP